MTEMMERTTLPSLQVPYVQWGPVIGGAVAAAALALVLHTFAGAIGLAVSSTAPTWRDLRARRLFSRSASCRIVLCRFGGN
jgi:hypothetical protein